MLRGPPEPTPEGRFRYPDDGRASLLVILDPEDGTFTEVSEGMYAAYGNYDPIMWGER